MRLQPGREDQPLAQMREVLVNREARRVGSGLEEHAAGLLEVDRVEPEAVDDGRGRGARGPHPALDLLLLFVVRHSEGDVMDGAGAPRSEPLSWQLAHLHPLARASTPDAEAMPAALLGGGLEAEGLVQEAGGDAQVPLPEPHRVEAADLMALGHGALRPRRPLPRAG